jgi:hypothetical protein
MKVLVVSQLSDGPIFKFCFIHWGICRGWMVSISISYSREPGSILGLKTAFSDWNFRQYRSPIQGYIKYATNWLTDWLTNLLTN